MSIMRPEGGWKITRPPVHPGEMLREEFMKTAGTLDQPPRSGTARAGHPHQSDRQRASRDYRRHSIALGAALRHQRRFLDEYSEGLRIATGPSQVIENDRETGPAAQGRSMTHGTRYRTPARVGGRKTAVQGNAERLGWWACADSNCRPLPCQGSALTN